MGKRKLYTEYIQIKMTKEDKKILEEVAYDQSTTASDLIRKYIRSLKHEN